MTAMYWITHVRYNAAKTHIDWVKGYASATPIKKESWARKDVVTNIEMAGTWATQNLSTNEQASVEIVVVNGVKYLRTARDNTPRDNLGDLPDF